MLRSLLSTFFMLTALSTQSVAGDYVIILHGIFRTSNHMKPLANHLTRMGYEVINLDYPSTRFSLEELIDSTAQEIDARTPDKTRTVHFVGYSMGSLVARGIVTKHRPAHLGRLVLLAPPNHGSEVADLLKNISLYKKLYGPAGQQLTTNNTATETLCGPVDYELGIIAGNRSIDPISSYRIPGENDGKVSIASTKLDGMQDHITLPASHTFFPSNKKVHAQVVAFLREGKFVRNGN